MILPPHQKPDLSDFPSALRGFHAPGIPLQLAGTAGVLAPDVHPSGSEPAAEQ